MLPAELTTMRFPQIEARLSRGLMAETTIKLSVRKNSQHPHFRQSQIVAQAEATAQKIQQHWRSLKTYAFEPTPVRTTETAVGKRYRPEPFLSVSIAGTGKRPHVGAFTIQLHQKGRDFDAFWLDVLDGYWVEKGAGEVETGQAGQEYTRPGAVLHKKYAVVRPTSRR
jgi:hypothetical protein